MRKKPRGESPRTKNADKKFLLLLLGWPLSAALYCLAVYVPGFAEGYHKTLYRAFNWAFGSLFGFLPFSLAEMLLYLLLLCLLFLLFFWLYKIIRAKRRFWVMFLRGVLRIVSVAGIVLFSFLLLWGVNYYRPSFAELTGLPVRDSTTDELYSLCKILAADANALRSQVQEDANGVFDAAADATALFSMVAPAYNNAAEEFPLLQGVTGPPKDVLYSKGLSAMGVSGIFVPFTFEANVNTAMPDVNLPFAACHESAHLLGFAPEDEANFIAYLACRASDNTAFAYSGAYTALVYATNALYNADSALYEDVMSLISDGVRRDMRDSSAYWNSFKGPVMDAHEQINDTYLKAQGQQDGTKSYGRMVDLLLALSRQENAA